LDQPDGRAIQCKGGDVLKTLRAGVIGLGVGEQHVIGYNALPSMRVVAVCDIDSKRLEDVATRNNVPARFTDYRKITEDPDIDVVSICSYDDAHAAQAVSAFRNGKHVMVEKPVALHRQEAVEVLRAWQDSGRKLSSNLILRHSPRFREIKRMIAAGEFGEIVALEGDYIHEILWKITEGWRGQMDFYCVTYGGGIHLIDLMRWLINDEVMEVSGMGNKILTRGSNYRYPDMIINLLRFAGGAVGKTMTIFGPRRPQVHTLNVFGTRKSFVNGLPDGSLFDGDKPENVHAMNSPYPAIAKSDLLPDFVAAIREDREPAVSGRDVFRVMDICFAAWESVEANRTVKVVYQV
jgi:predicted dehydrogenase